MEKRGPQINHLSFADDVIIFASSHKSSLQLIMKTLDTYEVVSDQLINRNKSYFMVPLKTLQAIVDIIKEVTDFDQKESPLTYLGCHLYIGRQRIIY